MISRLETRNSKLETQEHVGWPASLVRTPVHWAGILEADIPYRTPSSANPEPLPEAAHNWAMRC